MFNKYFLKTGIPKLLLGILFFISSQNIFAQTEPVVPEKKHHFSVYGGVGPNIYFNNLVLAKKDVNEINYSFVARFMWEPEYNLSLGIETGYIRLYTVSPTEAPGVHIKNDAIPIHIVISMKFLKSFYFNFASGQTILKNIVDTPNGNLDATTLSLGDLSGTLGYKIKLQKRMSIGAETKFFFSSKLDDKNMALVFMFGYAL